MAVNRRSQKVNGTRSAPLSARSTALLIIDLISDFKFEDGGAVARAALPAARNIRALRERARASRVPNVFVNDNQGKWKSDFRQMIARCSRDGCLGSSILQQLAPGGEDYFVLKPTHAGFFGTPLDQLLAQLRTKTLILAGISAHQCILFTANEAYLRDFKLIIPRDCTAAKTRREWRFALEYFSSVLHADTRASSTLHFK